MSTQRTTTDAGPTMTPRTDTAPLMFSTDNEVPIEGLFEAESDEFGH